MSNPRYRKQTSGGTPPGDVKSCPPGLPGGSTVMAGKTKSSGYKCPSPAAYRYPEKGGKFGGNFR